MQHINHAFIGIYTVSSKQKILWQFPRAPKFLGTQFQGSQKTGTLLAKKILKTVTRKLVLVPKNF